MEPIRMNKVQSEWIANYLTTTIKTKKWDENSVIKSPKYQGNVFTKQKFHKQAQKWKKKNFGHKIFKRISTHKCAPKGLLKDIFLE